MIKILALTEKEVKILDVTGLMAIGGSSSSGIRLNSLKSAEDYAVINLQGETLGVHALKGKKSGALEAKLFERLQLADLTLIPLRILGSQKAQDSSQESKVISEVSSLFSFLSGQVDLAPTLKQILCSLIDVFKMEKGFIVAKGINDKFDIVSNEGVNPNDPWLSETLLEETLKSANPVFVQNVIGSHFESNKSLVATGFLSIFAWPLRLRGEALGALVVGSSKPHSGLNDLEIKSADIYAQLSALLLSTYLSEQRLKEQVEALRKIRSEKPGPFLTSDARVEELNQLASRVATTDLSVLVLGETGVGKEVLSRWIHSHSEVGKGPFIAVNCGAIPENLIESTLFGHKKGSFTGAHADQIGKFQLANGGTLFLDEVGDLPANTQVKLLRALQEKVIEPVGASRPINVNVRVIAATHKPLKKLVESGQFREDLYYRLAEIVLEIPPLRERIEDIGLIASDYLKSQSNEKRLSGEAWQWLREQKWPGNVRELLATLKRASVLSNGETLDVVDFQSGLPKVTTQDQGWLGGDNLDEAIQSFLMSKVRKALELSGGNRKRAAELLGVTQRTLFRYLGEIRENMTDLSL